MGHKDPFHSLSVPHNSALPHEHASGHLEESEHVHHGEPGDPSPNHWEHLWIDIGGEG